jgi:dolichyl-phosphate beta-glucosyltransferase
LFFPQFVRLSVIIPAYNEEKRLPQTLEALRDFFAVPRGDIRLHEVIVSDDGSTDSTSIIAEEWKGRLPMVVLRFPKNRGKGAVTRAGMLAASGDYCLLYDADGATPLDEVPKLYMTMQDGERQVVIGSRLLKGEEGFVEMSKHRRLMGRVYHLLTGGLVPGILDTACGCKLFSDAAAKELFSLQTIDRFAFDVEILSLALAHGFRVVEVPVRWRAVEGSRVRVIRDTFQMTWCVVKLYLRRMVRGKNYGR